MDIFGRDNAFKGRLNHFFGSGGNHVEGELMTFPSTQDVEKQLDVFFKANLLSDGGQMFFTNTSKLRIMQQQICEFPALLHKVDI